MILSDYDITREIIKGGLVAGASSDRESVGIKLRLGKSYWEVCDDEYYYNQIPETGLLLGKGEFYLMSSNPSVTIPDHLCGFVNGRSTLGRHGVQVHMTAGLVDPGFVGNITLEVMSFAKDYLVYAGDHVGLLVLQEIKSPPMKSYADKGHHYNFQTYAMPPYDVPIEKLFAPEEIIDSIKLFRKARLLGA